MVLLLHKIRPPFAHSSEPLLVRGHELRHDVIHLGHELLYSGRPDALVAQGFTVLSCDRLGVGFSDPNTTGTLYTACACVYECACACEGACGCSLLLPYPHPLSSTQRAQARTHTHTETRTQHFFPRVHKYVQKNGRRARSRHGLIATCLSSLKLFIRTHLTFLFPIPTRANP